ncbi:MAG TPA: hypothetical protein VGN08_00635 [Solirubrobacteraceae bacterium]|jgi:citronellol/citronellal dehydrogenase
MSGTVASQVLRSGLLEGASVLVVAADPPTAGASSLALASAAACAELGAKVSLCPLTPAVDDSGIEAALELALGEMGTAQLLVVDAAALFAGGDPGAEARPGPEADCERGGAALRHCLELTWSATRAVFDRAFLPGAGGRVIYLAPALGAGEHAAAARAGLENLARTLSVEWARHAVTTVAIAPSDGSSPAEVAALVAYLASPAGSYFSGCLLDLAAQAPAAA